MECPKCETELNFSDSEMTLVSDQSNQVIVITCDECGESYEAIYSIDDVVNSRGDSLF